jgi:hypothetical protein
MQDSEHSLLYLNNFLGQQAPSLRSATFFGICPLLGSPFPLPNLTELNLNLEECEGKIRTSSLLSLCSSCPRLQRANINIDCQLQDVALDLIVSLDSLVGLEFTCIGFSRFIPFLKLSHLKRLRVSLRGEKVDKLTDLLPHDGHTLLSRATSMSLVQKYGSHVVGLSGNGVDVEFSVFDSTCSAGWFTDDTYIPFGRIENLEFRGYRTPADFPIHLYKKLTTFWVCPSNEEANTEVLGLLQPRRGEGIHFPSLREITYIYPRGANSWVKHLADLAREREQAGYKLELVRLPSTLPPTLYHEELKQHVGELRMDAQKTC